MVGELGPHIGDAKILTSASSVKIVKLSKNDTLKDFVTVNVKENIFY